MTRYPEKLPRQIYLASSWRNANHPYVLQVLRQAGHEVYDFRHPCLENDGFRWTEIDPDWQVWSKQTYRRALSHRLAESSFANDYKAMRWADTFVLLLPCGRSAHLEMGWAIGRGQDTYILLDEQSTPELMYKLANHVCTELAELIDLLD